ncbi:hypothetical protein EN780_03385 [Mesorhizobium sp. M4B.F.Ca.ET.089.01.1.1]|uniref:hypothetical protein n=1 Tax=Mesorhizobium sp. M4B.F.Ca.ET.089.01.1.1 TaxID=2496662 RepID=UPI000FE361D2|nr:hypothetical protein [Mesorhizobium sp. M4B.F.Ca.ET.089.01.1.1]RWX70451.1 hypothetical protein EN780_03385 [Mesorhizobium sp. M4B.F.Ca.ET.089.01.1.1]
MFRLKITPKRVLDLATAMMTESDLPEPAYNRPSAWVCKLWFDERNALADSIMRKQIFTIPSARSN